MRCLVGGAARGSEIRRSWYVALSLVLVAAVATVVTVVSTTSPKGSRRGSSSHDRGTAVSFVCANVKYAPLKAGQKVSVSSSLAGYRVTYSATTPHGWPWTRRPENTNTFDTGLPTSGKVVVEDGSGSVSSTKVRPIPRSDLGVFEADVTQICLFQERSGSPPDIMLGRYTGGASCCDVPLFLTYSTERGSEEPTIDLASTAYSSLRVNPNQGLEPVVERGVVLFEGSDASFPGEFGCFACTPAPIRLLRLAGTMLKVVTSAYPALVKHDASKIWKLVFAQNGYFTYGALAAWVADECTIGSGAKAWTLLNSLIAGGRVKPTVPQYGSSSNAPFVPSLHAFLSANGYCLGSPAGRRR